MVEFEEQYYSASDLTEFFALTGLDGNETPVEVIGPNDQSNPGTPHLPHMSISTPLPLPCPLSTFFHTLLMTVLGGEANLDIQWMMAMAPRIDTVFWSIPENSTQEIDDILTVSPFSLFLLLPLLLLLISFSLVVL